jgi:hypothetical protein
MYGKEIEKINKVTHLPNLLEHLFTAQTENINPGDWKSQLHRQNSEVLLA